jgi:hypothetical protein
MSGVRVHSVYCRAASDKHWTYPFVGRAGLAILGFILTIALIGWCMWPVGFVMMIGAGFSRKYVNLCVGCKKTF